MQKPIEDMNQEELILRRNDCIYFIEDLKTSMDIWDDDEVDEKMVELGDLETEVEEIDKRLKKLGYMIEKEVI